MHARFSDLHRYFQNWLCLREFLWFSDELRRKSGKRASPACLRNLFSRSWSLHAQAARCGACNYVRLRVIEGMSLTRWRACTRNWARVDGWGTSALGDFSPINALWVHVDSFTVWLKYFRKYYFSKVLLYIYDHLTDHQNHFQNWRCVSLLQDSRLESDPCFCSLQILMFGLT